MRIGAIADIHGNQPALEAVLADMPAVDMLVCAGDVVGYNPWPAECVDLLRDRDVPTVMGNHDRAVAKGTAFQFNELARAGVEFSQERLTDEQITWLQALPTNQMVCDGAVKIVHGHPADPDRYTYPGEFSEGLLEDESVLILGHTHVQHIETFEQGIVCNPGSVGQPRDGDPRAGYAVIDLIDGAAEAHRVAYDIETVVAKIDEVGLPERLGLRLQDGR